MPDCAWVLFLKGLWKVLEDTHKEMDRVTVCVRIVALAEVGNRDQAITEYIRLHRPRSDVIPDLTNRQRAALLAAGEHEGYVVVSKESLDGQSTDGRYLLPEDLTV